MSLIWLLARGVQGMCREMVVGLRFRPGRLCHWLAPNRVGEGSIGAKSHALCTASRLRFGECYRHAAMPILICASAPRMEAAVAGMGRAVTQLGSSSV
jgi:hypothetical protein